MRATSQGEPGMLSKEIAQRKLPVKTLSASTSRAPQPVQYTRTSASRFTFLLVMPAMLMRPLRAAGGGGARVGSWWVRFSDQSTQPELWWRAVRGGAEHACVQLPDPMGCLVKDLKVPTGCRWEAGAGRSLVSPAPSASSAALHQPLTAA